MNTCIKAKLTFSRIRTIILPFSLITSNKRPNFLFKIFIYFPINIHIYQYSDKLLLFFCLSEPESEAFFSNTNLIDLFDKDACAS